MAQVVFAKYGFSNIGGYNEVAQVIVATYSGSVQDAVGKPLLFGPGSIHVAHTADEFMAIPELQAAVGHFATIARHLLSL